MSTFTKCTPWGYADQVSPLGAGMFQVMTPGHGGFFVPDDLIARMPAALRYSNTYSGGGNWFEEDCEWALPVLAFPEHFDARHCFYAIKTVASYADATPDRYFHRAAQWLAHDARAQAVKAKAATWAEKLTVAA